MSTCRYATSADLPALHRIWAASFPEDTEADRTAFFAVATLDRCLVAECEGTVASMVFSLPSRCDGQQLQYIYAAATHPDYRGRGLFGDLLTFAQAEAKREGCVGSFLRPAEPSLANYYARFGYTQWWHCAAKHGTAGESATITLLSPAEYVSRRLGYLPDPHVEWDADLLGFALQSASAYAIGDTVALCEIEGDTLVVKEWLGDGDPADLCAALGCTRYTARCVGESDPFVLFCPFYEEFTTLSAYVGLVFD